MRAATWGRPYEEITNPPGRAGGGPPKKKTRGAPPRPRVEAKAPDALPDMAAGQQREDFCAAARRKSNGIFEGCQKSRGLF